MILYTCLLVIGLILLVWSADKFIDGAASVASHYGMSPLLIGMIVIGFGTSAPEMIVSVLAAYQGNSGMALGNAYGSNITNIALILGVTAILKPINFHSQVLKKELPILFIITLVSVALLYDLELSRTDAFVLLGVFIALMSWTLRVGMRDAKDALAKEVKVELTENHAPSVTIKKSFFLLIMGLLVLIASSRLLVYGAVGIATSLGVSDLIVGLTIVAIGTSLPEFASSIIAARKGESDIALGNVIGSNLFNTLAVVGLSGAIHPLGINRDIFNRDLLAMTILTFSLFIFGFGFKKEGRINRVEGLILLIGYISYTAYLIFETFK